MVDVFFVEEVIDLNTYRNDLIFYPDVSAGTHIKECVDGGECNC